jgi:tetratricopeptide (TPR) repeat protein
LLLAIMWATLPVQLHRPGEGGTNTECLTLADGGLSSDPVSHIPLLEQCRTVVVNDAQLVADLGAAYEAAGRNADAQRAYRDALAIDPEFADVHLKLAAQLLTQGAAGEARSHVEAALRIQPNRRAALDLLGEVAAAK